MSKAKHTPGPWSVNVTGDDDIRVCQTDKGQCICCVALMGDCDDETSWSTETIETWKANAHLIAAAPDLLNALRDCLAEMGGREKSCGHQFTCVCVSDNARAAIAKAEGRTG